MAKLKAAKGKRKTTAKSAWHALPCGILIVGIMALIFLLFFYGLRG